jgi:galactoside O-acetyltransferase
VVSIKGSRRGRRGDSAAALGYKIARRQQRRIALPEQPFLSAEELKAIGFSEIGEHLQISRKASFYRISGRIGDHVRIDDFCILKGHVELGSYVHLAAFCSVSGAWDKVTIADFVTVSNRVSIFTGSDDFGASTLNNTHDEQYTIMLSGPVAIGIAALIGAHSVILPGVEIGDGASVGALSLVAKSIPPGGLARGQGIAIVHPERTRDFEKMRAQARDFLARTKANKKK